MNPNIPDLVIIHHTADTYSGKQYQKINEYHRQRWNFKSELGSYVGYHWLIEKDGEMVKCRNMSEEAAHTRGHNTHSIGVALAGNFDEEYPTESQLNTLQTLLDYIFIDRRWKITDIAFHKEFADTACPGKNFTEKYLIVELIKRATNIFRKIILWSQLITSKR